MPIRNDITKSRVLRIIDQFNPNDGYITFSDVAKELFCDWATARKHVGKYEETRNAFLSKQEARLDVAEKAIFEASKTDISALKYLLSTKGKHRGYGLPISGSQHNSDLFDQKQDGEGQGGGNMLFLSDDKLNRLNEFMNELANEDTEVLTVESSAVNMLPNEETEVYEMVAKSV